MKKSDYNNSSSAGGGISFSGLLTILFIGLKLTNYIDWDWIWVLSPLWIALLVYIVVLVIYLIIIFKYEIRGFIQNVYNKRNKNS